MGQQTLFLSLLVLWACSARADAASRTLVVGVGRCETPALQSGTAAVQAALSRAGTPVVPPQEAAAALSLHPRPTLASLQVRLAELRRRAFGADAAAVLPALRALIGQLREVSPLDAPWPTLGAAWALQAQVHRILHQDAEGREAWRQVLRVDPAFALDRDETPPASLAAFAALKKELAAERTSVLSLQTIPQGAPLFLEGRPIGLSPLTLHLGPGQYVVSAAEGAHASAPHALAVPHAGSLTIDLGLETSASAGAVACVDSSDGSARPAVHWAQLVDAPRVVVVLLTPLPEASDRLTATIYTVAPVQRAMEVSGPPAEVAGQIAREP